MRADLLLLERGLASSRSQAQRLIKAGVRWHCAGAWKAVSGNSDELPADARVELLDAAEARFVSRGGLKLEGALQHVGLDVAGALCLDLGQSTGGFTDCLLRAGARKVVGVDVGYGQLHPSLREDIRVVAIEGVNARSMTLDSLLEDAARAAPTDPESAVAGIAGGFDVLVGDLAFISLTLVLPAAVPLVKPGGAVLMLVKPQFELQPGQVGKRGIVKDAALYVQIEQRIRDSCQSLGLTVLEWFDSPITGGDGNREFFVFARRLA
ncbi:MAG: TlyA family RNA methyltransferase [Burkholderiaceae bacterium]|nr:TlyA family RNA methyltransferase [Burkholderiaceae bacterium]